MTIIVRVSIGIFIAHSAKIVGTGGLPGIYYVLSRFSVTKNNI